MFGKAPGIHWNGSMKSPHNPTRVVLSNNLPIFQWVFFSRYLKLWNHIRENTGEKWNITYENMTLLLFYSSKCTLYSFCMSCKWFIIPFVKLTEELPINVRFIEEMPFNGKGQRAIKEVWNYNKILEKIEAHYQKVEYLVSKKSSTSKNFKERFTS